MTKKLRIAIAQLNLKVGDITGNLQKHISAATHARDHLSADVIIFPELSIIGYPAEDLLLRPAFLEAADAGLNHLIKKINGIHYLVGHPRATPAGVQNTCSLIKDGIILGQYAKQYLPNYGVFDERRYFIPGNKTCVVPIQGVPVGLVICEDLWHPAPTRDAVQQGARIILSPNASPFEMDKYHQRATILATLAQQNHVAIIYANLIGGQDGVIFDGGSMVVNAAGLVCQTADFFREHIFPVEIDITPKHTIIEKKALILPGFEESMYLALVLGVRDYIEKNNFSNVVVGVSGGIDSALTLAVAVDALGKDRVTAVLMPSRYTADISMQDAKELIDNLQVKSDIISIEPVYQSFLETLAPFLKDKKTGITEENIQARCRAVILMALSNKFRQLVLTTGNRSELAVGYCTLYGDMAGAYAVLKDVFKTEVYQLALYRNKQQAVIPQRSIERAPTAELAFDQTDQDSLPPYPILDEILRAYLNHSKSMDEIIADGFARDMVVKVINMVHKNEYKRSQMPVGTRVNHQSFDKEWRYPLTNGF